MKFNEKPKVEEKLTHLENWIEEKNSNFLGMRYRITETLFSGKSEFQSVDVVNTVGYGKMLLNDGLVMVTERDEHAYHEMITHVPLFVHPNPKRVLVIGGGDGGTAREVLRHPSVEYCKMVEIDGMVIDACKEHIPQTSVSFEHPNMHLVVDDAVKFVAETDETFDVILVDSTDPIGPAQPLFGAEFYKNIYKCLNENGIVVSQGESPFYEEKMQGVLMSVLHDQFEVVALYNFSNMTYPGGLWSFSFASKGLKPVVDFDGARVSSSGMDFEYYNKELHAAAFCLPEFMKKRLAKFIKE